MWIHHQKLKNTSTDLLIKRFIKLYYTQKYKPFIPWYDNFFENIQWKWYNEYYVELNNLIQNEFIKNITFFIKDQDILQIPENKNIIIPLFNDAYVPHKFSHLFNKYSFFLRNEINHRLALLWYEVNEKEKTIIDKITEIKSKYQGKKDMDKQKIEIKKYLKTIHSKPIIVLFDVIEEPWDINKASLKYNTSFEVPFINVSEKDTFDTLLDNMNTITGLCQTKIYRTIPVCNSTRHINEIHYTEWLKIKVETNNKLIDAQDLYIFADENWHFFSTEIDTSILYKNKLFQSFYKKYLVSNSKQMVEHNSEHLKIFCLNGFKNNNFFIGFTLTFNINKKRNWFDETFKCYYTFIYKLWYKNWKISLKYIDSFCFYTNYNFNDWAELIPLSYRWIPYKFLRFEKGTNLETMERAIKLVLTNNINEFDKKDFVLSTNAINNMCLLNWTMNARYYINPFWKLFFSLWVEWDVWFIINEKKWTVDIIDKMYHNSNYKQYFFSPYQNWIFPDHFKYFLHSYTIPSSWKIVFELNKIYNERYFDVQINDIKYPMFLNQQGKWCLIVTLY